jgi:peptidoglycan/LPS O-acetylase OafA/YrhL
MYKTQGSSLPVNNELSKRVYFFDGLRGWAAIMVLIHHTVLTFPELYFLRRTPLRLFIDGTYAVYIFFVLSGVVLSIGFFRNKDTKILSALAIKRIPRLSIPILLSCVILVPLMKYGLFFNITAAEIEGGNNWLSGFYTFKGNFIEAIKFSVRDVFFNYSPVNSYNSSLWTMAGELSGSYLVIITLLVYKHFSKNYLIWSFLFIYIWCIDNILFFYWEYWCLIYM